MYNSIHRKSPLEISELAKFDKNIEGSTPSEIRLKRIAYLKQAVEQVGFGKSIFKAFGCVIVPFAIIPLFWPMLLFFYFMRNNAIKMIDSQIHFALEYWSLTREDVIQ